MSHHSGSESDQKDLTKSINEASLVKDLGGNANFWNCSIQVGAGNNEQSTTGSPTAGSSASKSRSDTSEMEDGFVQIADDIFINTKKPLKEGSKIYEGYQEYVTGQRQRIAIKAIFPCTTKSMREVQHLVTLTPHPNVVRIIRAKENNDHVPTLYIAMELCSSKNLQDYLKENREKNAPVDFKKTMSYCKRLIKGMKHIHCNRIIHGDLKPENILFSLVGDQIKVSDFGISKQLEWAKSKTKRTNQGTDGYRAPETYNFNDISMKADIFSLGVILYALFTNGKHPFGDDNDLWIFNIKKNRGRDLSDLPEEMGDKKDEFLDLSNKMLEHDLEKRPTIEEISMHPFFSGQATTAQASQQEESLPEPPSVMPTTPERTFASEETHPKEGREVTVQTPDLDPPHLPGISPEGTSHRVFTSAQTQPKQVSLNSEEEDDDQSNESCRSGIREQTLSHVTLFDGNEPSTATLLDGGAGGKIEVKDSIVNVMAGNYEMQSHHQLGRGPSSSNLSYYDVVIQRRKHEGFGLVIISSVKVAEQVEGNHITHKIRRIIDGSPAARCKQLCVGDRILAVNCVDIHDLHHGQIVNLIKDSGMSIMLRVACLPSPDEGLRKSDCFTVDLQWSRKGFGFGIRGGREYNMPLYVLRMAEDGPAAQSGKIQIGDMLVQINGHDAAGMLHSDAINCIKQGGSSARLVLRKGNGAVPDIFGTASGTIGARSKQMEEVPTKLKGTNYDQPSTSCHPNVMAQTSTAVIGSVIANKNEEKADELIKHSKYEEAISLLEYLPPAKWQQTQLLECYFQLKRDSRLPKCIKTMKMLMMRHPRPKPDDVFKLGETNSENSSHSKSTSLFSWSSILQKFASKPDENLSHIKALTFFSCTSKLYVLDSKPDYAVLGIASCSFYCMNVIKAMVGQSNRMRVLAIDIGIGIVNEMLVDIRSITHADADRKVKCESFCLNNLGRSYRAINKLEKAIEIYKQGIEIMKRHFGPNASKYQTLGDLLHSMGVANKDLGNYCEAEKLFLESLKAYELAQDYANEEEKKTDIDNTQRNLQRTRKKMQK